MVKVSICIPTYNQADYLAQALSSALGQDFDSFEVVVSDNHSTDRTPEVLGSFRDPRLKVCRPPEHLTMGANWRFCVDNSTGEYFTLLSSDDLLEPSHCRRMSAILDQNPQVAFAHCAIYLIDGSGRRIGQSNIHAPFVRSGEEELPHYIGWARCPLVGTLFRRECYEKVGGFGDWEMLADWDLWLRILEVGDVAYCPELLASYRIWATPERMNRTLVRVRENIQIYESTVARLISDRPYLAPLVPRARRRKAIMTFACSIHHFRGSPQLPELRQAILALSDDSLVRLCLALQTAGAGPIFDRLLRAKFWCWQRVNALVFHFVRQKSIFKRESAIISD